MAKAVSERPETPRPAAAPPGPARPRARNAFLVAVGVLSVLVSIGAGFSIAGIRYFESKIEKIPVGADCGTENSCLPSVDEHCVNEACNFLILGSDTRAGLSKEQQVVYGSPQRTKGQRADSIMVVHVDAKEDRTIILQIPRDLRVDIPGHGIDKINTAFEYGADAMVRTIEQFTRLQINNYVQVNFLGFQNLVNALGGVPICIDRPMIDPLAGLNLPHRGCYNLEGPQALAFVRARHVEGDTIPDFARIARQQQFIRAAISKALSAGSVLHLPALVRAAQGNLVRDENLNLYELQDLINKLAEVGQEGVDFRVVPAVPTEIGGIDYLIPVQPMTEAMFRLIRLGRPLGNRGKEEPLTPISPANITVRVLDARSNGRVNEAVAFLEKAGFVVLGVEDAPENFTESVLLYEAGFQKQETVASRYLTGVPVHVNHQVTEGADVTLVVAGDYSGPRA